MTAGPRNRPSRPKKVSKTTEESRAGPRGTAKPRRAADQHRPHEVIGDEYHDHAQGEEANREADGALSKKS